MWVKHPLLDEDGDITIAGPDGKPITRPMVRGVFDWPDDLPLHNSYQPSPAPAELIEIQRKQDIEKLIEQAKALGLKVEVPEDESDDDGDSGVGESVPDAKTQKKRKKKDE